MSETTTKSCVNPHNTATEQLSEQQVFDSLLLAKYKALEELKSINAEIDKKESERSLITQSINEPWDNQSWWEQRG
jgi:hypothetical protein